MRKNEWSFFMLEKKKLKLESKGENDLRNIQCLIPYDIYVP